VKIEQHQEADSDNYYVWLYEGSQWKQKLYGGSALTLLNLNQTTARGAFHDATKARAAKVEDATRSIVRDDDDSPLVTPPTLSYLIPNKYTASEETLIDKGGSKRCKRRRKLSSSTSFTTRISADHTKRVTIQQEDIQLARRLHAAWGALV
jgi:hypothetical protein